MLLQWWEPQKPEIGSKALVPTFVKALLMPMKIDQVGAASVISNGTRYETADDMQVYLWYKGQYYATKLSEVNSEGYYLTGWYDNFGCAAGKRVRVIVAVKKD